jgi:hypothetical protein
MLIVGFELDDRVNGSRFARQLRLGVGYKLYKNKIIKLVDIKKHRDDEI